MLNCSTSNLRCRMRGPEIPAKKDCKHFGGDDWNLIWTNCRSSIKGSGGTSLEVGGMSCDNMGRAVTSWSRQQGEKVEGGTAGD